MSVCSERVYLFFVFYKKNTIYICYILLKISSTLIAGFEEELELLGNTGRHGASLQE